MLLRIRDDPGSRHLVEVAKRLVGLEIFLDAAGCATAALRAYVEKGVDCVSAGVDDVAPTWTRPAERGDGVRTSHLERDVNPNVCRASDDRPRHLIEVPCVPADVVVIESRRGGDVLGKVAAPKGTQRVPADVEIAEVRCGARQRPEAVRAGDE